MYQLAWPAWFLVTPTSWLHASGFGMFFFFLNNVMLQRFIITFLKKHDFIMLIFPVIQSQSWLTGGGKNLATFTSHLFQAARTPTILMHTGFRLHKHAYNSIMSALIIIITRIMKDQYRSLVPCTVMSYRRRCFWWSDLPWLDARCVHLLS